MLISDFDKIDLNNLHASISKLPDKDKRLIERAEAITREKSFSTGRLSSQKYFMKNCWSGRRLIGKPIRDLIV
jgi:hypothetical protein